MYLLERAFKRTCKSFFFRLIEREREKVRFEGIRTFILFRSCVYIRIIREREREMLKEPFQKRREPLESRFNIPFFLYTYRQDSSVYASLKVYLK